MIKLLVLLYYMFMLPSAIGYIFESVCRNEKKMIISFFWKGIILQFFAVFILWRFIVRLNQNFRVFCFLYSSVGILIIITAAAISLSEWYKKRKKGFCEFPILEKSVVLIISIFVGLFLFQAANSRNIVGLYSGDRMGIYVNTMVSEEDVFTVNPATGGEYIGQGEISYTGLAAFYSFLVSVSKVNVLTLLYKVVPIWMLCLFYSIQYSFGRDIFHDNIKKTWLYCVGTALINIWGTGKRWMLSSFLLCNSWTEDALQICIVIPLIVWMLIRLMIGVKKRETGIFLLVLVLLFVVSDDIAIWKLGGLAIVAAIVYGIKRIRI